MSSMPPVDQKVVNVNEKEIRAPYSGMKRPATGPRTTTNEFGRQMEREAEPPLARFFSNLMDNDIVRYTLYIFPVAIALGIPLALFCTIWADKSWTATAVASSTVLVAGTNTTLKGGTLLNGTFTGGTIINGALVNGTATGGVVQQTQVVELHKKGILLWLELCWAFLWIAKIIATIIPAVFGFLSGMVTTGLRKYALVLKAVKTPLSIFLWAILCIASYNIIYVFEDQKIHKKYSGTNNPMTGMVTFHKVLKVSTGMSALWLAEKMLVQLISVNYHAKAHADKIQDIKKTSKAIDLLYEASLRRYHDYHPDLVDEDILIHDTSGVQKLLGEKETTHATRRFFGSLRWTANKVTTAFGQIASDITGQDVLNPTATHSVVEGALERKAGAEAMARRIFKSLCPAHADAITEQDMVDEFGADRTSEARWIFSQLDRDGNGDVSLDEMILLICGIARSRKDLWKSSCDIKDAVKVLDSVLSFIVFVIVCFFYAAFFSTVLSTKANAIWTTFAGGAFAVANTVGEFNAACIFVFIKHAYDVGDRINMNNVEYEVTKISLLYSVFRRVDNGTILSVGNQVLATVWIENVTRSGQMKERLQFSVASGTSFDDIELLRVELEKFVQDPENSHHFQPEIDIQLISVGDLKQLDLRVEILHKSNWAIESLRAERRSRFMCALLSAMRKVPIDGPGGSGPGAGSINNPTYSVPITDEIAKESRAKFDADKDAKKMANQPELMNDTGVSSSLDILRSLRRKNPDPPQNPFVGQGTSFETSRSISYAPAMNYPPHPAPGPGFV